MVVSWNRVYLIYGYFEKDSIATASLEFSLDNALPSH